jgi:hypothetical protein
VQWPCVCLGVGVGVGVSVSVFVSVGKGGQMAKRSERVGFDECIDRDRRNFHAQHMPVSYEGPVLA